MTRHKRRFLVTIALFACGVVLIVIGYCGWTLNNVLPAQYLGFIFVATGLLGLFGVNIWYGGPLDLRLDRFPGGPAAEAFAVPARAVAGPGLNEMPTTFFAEWTFVGHCCGSGPFEIDGVDVFKHKWNAVVSEKPADVKDPLHGQPHRFEVVEIITGGKRIVFAGGEFSNNVWGFYQRRTIDEQRAAATVVVT